MIIKAGTYRWNDNVDFDTLLNTEGYIPLEVKLPPFECTYQGINGVLTIDGILTDLAIAAGTRSIAFLNTSSYVSCLFNGQQISSALGVVPLVNGEWNPYVYITSSQTMPLSDIFTSDMSDYGKTFEVVKDTVWGDEIGTWFTKSTKPVTDSTPAVEITYKDKVITLEAGQTARLHNADGSDFGFTEDLVIKANEVNVPTYITVATVDDLPTDSADGTIAIVEG